MIGRPGDAPRARPRRATRLAPDRAGRRRASPQTAPGGDAPRPAGYLAAAPSLSSEAASSATCVGVRPTRTPRLSSACAFARAVPREPETIAPAWPIVLPGGAVNPAM